MAAFRLVAVLLEPGRQLSWQHPILTRRLKLIYVR